MILSYVIVTYNRREPLLTTLRHLHATTPLAREDWEVWVVDNASTDGTDAAVREQFPSANYIKRPTNEGVWARSVAFEPAKGKYIILLDDDSYPINDAVTRSINHLNAHPACAAVVGKVILPDGSQEGCAIPAVMLSGAVCIRRDTLLKVGGFRPEFFRKAGEYDLSYRIWQAGQSVERLEDVEYRHDKVMTGRSKPFAHRMDLRNNLILVERYLPSSVRAAVRQDITQRYTALARHEGCAMAAMQARIEGFIWRIREHFSGRQTLSTDTVEQIYQFEGQARQVADFTARHNPERVVIADFSKNLYATWQACQSAGLQVVAISDDHAAFANLTYRAVPVLPLERALALSPDAIILSNTNPAQCRDKLAHLQKHFKGPILSLWQPAYTNLAQLNLSGRIAA